jgi:hypothetical protein
LYFEYGIDEFKGLTVSEEEDPKLYKFIEDVKLGGPKFYGHPIEDLEYFARRIYELRKN